MTPHVVFPNGQPGRVARTAAGGQPRPLGTRPSEGRVGGAGEECSARLGAVLPGVLAHGHTRGRITALLPHMNRAREPAVETLCP